MYRKLSGTWGDSVPENASTTLGALGTLGGVGGQNPRSVTPQFCTPRPPKVAKPPKVSPTEHSAADRETETPAPPWTDQACAHCGQVEGFKQECSVGGEPLTSLHPDCQVTYRDRGGTAYPETPESPSDPGDIPGSLRRCHHCGKPGAERWDWHGRTVHLHDDCLHPWRDQQERAR
jgi:hypothetical protein